MPFFVHERVRIFIAADGTEMRDVSLMRTGRGYGNVLKGMPVRRNKIVRITVAAVFAGIDGIALLRTVRRDHLRRFIVVFAYAVDGGIAYRRAHRHDRRRLFRLCVFRACTGNRSQRRDESYRKYRNEFQKFFQVPSPFFLISCPLLQFEQFGQFFFEIQQKRFELLLYTDVGVLFEQ